MAAPAKAAGALRTIGELSAETGLPQHILRYWETRFSQLRPLQRAGNRRYYRPEDVALVRRIDRLLNQDGYTIRGVQTLLKRDGRASDEPPSDAGAGADTGAGTDVGRGAGTGGGVSAQPGQPAPASTPEPLSSPPAAAPSSAASSSHAARIALDGLGSVRDLLVRALAEDTVSRD